jgi:hypothetical protein
MTDHAEQPSDYTPKETVGPRITSEGFDVPGMTLSRRHWNRLKSEAAEAKMGWSELWLGAAFAFFGVGAAAWIAFWALPNTSDSEPGATQLSSEGQDLLRIIGSFCVALAVVCFLGWLQKRRDHNASLDRLIANMKSHEHDA